MNDDNIAQLGESRPFPIGKDTRSQFAELARANHFSIIKASSYKPKVFGEDGSLSGSEALAAGVIGDEDLVAVPNRDRLVDGHWGLLISGKNGTVSVFNGDIVREAASTTGLRVLRWEDRSPVAGSFSALNVTYSLMRTLSLAGQKPTEI